MQTPDNKSEKVTSGTHLTYWTETAAPILYHKLNKDISCDVVVVGGGIAGVTTAYCLSTAGKKVALVEDGFIGSGETGRTTAHLVTALDDRYYDLEKIFGNDDTALIADSHREAINFVEQTVRREKINCHFERLSGYLFLHPSDQKESIDQELAAASRAGLDVEKVTHIPGITHIEGAAIEFRNQAQFHPLLYLKGLCSAIVNNGGLIFTETHAKEISKKGIVSDEGFSIKAEHVVVATNSPVNNRFVLHLKQLPFRTYVIGATVKKGSLPKALWWDTGDIEVNPDIPPYHYVRLQEFNEMYDLLIVGGEDHPTGAEDGEMPEEKRYIFLETWARRHFNIGEVIYKWSGQVLEPHDGIAFIGHNPFDNSEVYVVSGDSGNGMTHGTIAGMLLTDLITGVENRWEKIYTPSRLKIFKTGKQYAEAVYNTMADFFRSDDGKEISETLAGMRQGEARLVELNKEKYGAYCEENDKVHVVSAKCTHLNCTVNWNSDEKTWDCPCHGSRFTYEGKVVNGPANKPLKYFQASPQEIQNHHYDEKK